ESTHRVKVCFGEGARHGAVVHLTVSRRQVWRHSSKVIEEVVTASLKVGKGALHRRTKAKWVDIKPRSGGVRRRVWRRSLVTEKQSGDQAEAVNAARKTPAAIIEPSEGYKKPVAGNVAIPAENAIETLPEIGNDHNVGLVIAGAGFDPRLPLTHLIGCSQIRVPIGASNFKTTEFVWQKEVDHGGEG